MTEIEEILHRGEQANQLMQHGAFKDTVADLERRYYMEWVSSKDTAQREALFARVGVLKDFVAELAGWVTASEQVQQNIEEENAFNAGENDYVD